MPFVPLQSIEDKDPGPGQPGVDPELDRALDNMHAYMPVVPADGKIKKTKYTEAEGYPSMSTGDLTPRQILQRERAAQAEKAAAVPRFVPLKDADKPKDEQKKDFIDTFVDSITPHGAFWEALSEGGIEGMLKESLPAEIGERMADVHDAKTIMDKRGEVGKELERRKAAGESTNFMAMQTWEQNRINDLIKETKPQSKPLTVAETWNAIKTSAADNPGGFMGKMARGLIVHPELLVTPEAMPLRAAQMLSQVGKTAARAVEAGTNTVVQAGVMAGKAGRIGAEGVQIGAAAGAESALSQLNQKGTADATQTATDAVMAAAPLVVGRALMPRGKASVGLAADYALEKNLKTAGAETSPELVKQAVAQTEARVAAGMPIHEALRESLEAVKVSPEVAADVAKILEPVEPVNPIASAVVRFNGKEYDGRTHIDAINKAKADGIPLRDDGRTPVYNHEAGDSINLFRTKDGKVITRDEAGDLVGAKRTEDMKPLKGDERAADEKGQEDQKGDGQGIRQGEGEEGVLRQPKQGDDQGNAPKEKEGLTPNELTAKQAEANAAVAKKTKGKVVPKTEAPVTESAKDSTGLAGMGGKMAKSISESLYQNLFDALKAGKTTMAGIKDPALARAKAAFDAGLIKGPEDIRRFEKEGYPKVPAAEGKTRPQQFTKLEGVAKEAVPADKVAEVYKLAGFEAEDAVRALGGKDSMSIGTLRRKLTKEMGGEKYADDVLRDAVVEGHIRGLEAGRVDPILLGALGLTGVGALGAALYRHDPTDAVWGALATGGAIAAMALLKRSARGVGEVMQHFADTRYRPEGYIDEWRGQIRGGELTNSRFAEQIKALVSKKKDREAITHWLQDPTTTPPLKPEQHAAAMAIRDFFEVMGEKGKQAGILPEDLINDYVTQLWTGLNKNKSLKDNLIASLGKRNTNSPGMSPKSQFAMQRIIPSYKEGMAQGLVPSTLDIAQIVRIYGDNINKAIANKNLIRALELGKHPDVFIDAEGKVYQQPLMMRDTPEAQIKGISKGAAITDRQWDGGGEIAKDFRDQAIEHAARGYVDVNHPQLKGYKVHEDIATVMKHLFSAPADEAYAKLGYAISVAAKRALFSYSLFHVKSLGDAMLATGVSAWGKILSGEASRALKNPSSGHDPLMDLARAGLNVVERPLEGDVTPFTNALKLIEERHPVVGAPIKGLRMIGGAMDSFLWNTVHPTFKAATALAAYEKNLMHSNNPSMMMRAADAVLGKREANISRLDAAKSAASYTNDIFGGIDWFQIADGVQNRFGRDLALSVTSAKGRQFMQVMMLAPDWTVATTRAMVKAIPGITRRETAALHQGYALRSILMYAILGDGLNQYFSGHHFWENEDPTMIDLGDGRKMQMSKHFMEPFHWYLGFWKQAMNKLGYLPKELIEQGLNKEYVSEKGSPPIKNRFTHPLKGLLPITAQQALDGGSTPALSGFFGLSIFGKTEEQAEEQARENAREKLKNYDPDKAKPGEHKPLSEDKAAERARKRFERLQRKREEK